MILKSLTYFVVKQLVISPKGCKISGIFKTLNFPQEYMGINWKIAGTGNLHVVESKILVKTTIFNAILV